MYNKKKSTHDLLEDMKRTRDYDSFCEVNKGEFAQEGQMKIGRALSALLEEKGIEKRVAVKRSGLMDKYAYQIFSDTKHPSRDKVLALCIGMQLSVERVQELLRVTGYPLLYPRIKRDSIIMYGMENGYDIISINNELMEYGFQIIE